MLHPLMLHALVFNVLSESADHPGPNVLKREQLAAIGRNQLLGKAVVAADVPTSWPLLPNRETLIIMTPTHPGHDQRTLLFRRQISSLRVAMLARQRLWTPDALSRDAQQLLWVVVEDGEFIDKDVQDLLTCRYVAGTTV